jgi:hypothetical protein
MRRSTVLSLPLQLVFLGLADAYQLKLTPPFEKIKINTFSKNFFVSLTTSNNTKSPIMTQLYMGQNTLTSDRL